MASLSGAGRFAAMKKTEKMVGKAKGKGKPKGKQGDMGALGAFLGKKAKSYGD